MRGDVPAHRLQLPINDAWTFAFGEHPGAESGERGDDGWYDVGIPHSFSIPDYRESDFYVGFGCYRRRLDIEEEWLTRRVAIEFLGVFQRAEVFLNGRRVGGHVGGYTGFVVELTPYLTAGANDLFVRVDNSWDARVAPRAGDYSFSGGIYRDVTLLVTDPVRIAWNGVFVRTPEILGDHAALAVSVEIENRGGPTGDARVEAAVLLGDDIVAEAVAPVPADPGLSVVEIPLGLPAPVLWSPESPVLYRLRARVVVDGAVRDEEWTPFGVRSLGWFPHDGFFLNGERYELHGANAHQNHGGWADAVTRAGVRRDVSLLKGAGFNSVRGSHYPHHPVFADECDRQGLLYWSELCFWGTGGANIDGYWFASAYPPDPDDRAEFEQQTEQTLREMIRQHRNHPSVFVWSVGNEVFFSDDDVLPEAKAFTRRLVGLCHELDPTRAAAVGGAQRKEFDRLGDVAGYNGDGAEIYIDPGLPNLVAEYHGNKGRRPGVLETAFEYGVEQPARWRAGKFLWSAFHYKTIFSSGGQDGIVDYWRLPRQAWHWYRRELLGIPVPPPAVAGRATGLVLTADAPEFAAGGRDDVQVRVRTVDDEGRWVSAELPVELEVVSGGALLPGGSRFLLSPETESFLGGEGAVEVRSYVSGPSRIVARAEGLGEASMTVRVVDGPAWRPDARVRHMPPAPSRMPVPPSGGTGMSFTAYRPVRVSSFAAGHEGMHVADIFGDGWWQPADGEPGAWVLADFEFSYIVRRVEIRFAEPPTGDWVIQSVEGDDATDVARGSGGDRVQSFRFHARSARAIRVTFPGEPVGIEAILAA